MIFFNKLTQKYKFRGILEIYVEKVILEKNV